ncbi:ComF family protein [Microbulbifer spongiae]|uniref:ComF family protein n=1 Tax=Microbulbifer spongiae TaxID=2944933 RepID=A0ABY9ECA4_9GAMM|nr:ComF family protein [Microbulbifer sp. MI-G]WKD50095.1 ComF family protein [Microbulbifer sp. MI-G]
MVYHSLSALLSHNLAQCLLCGDRAGESGLCTPCAAELPRLGNACETCAQPLPSAARYCPDCLRQPPHLSGVRAAWQYAYPVNQLIQRFKYRGDLAAGHSLVQLAAQVMEPAAERPDLLAPIPLHWRRYWRRGYNQAQLIAAGLGRHWQLPVRPRLLRKVVATQTQSQLRRPQRLRNLLQSFALRENVGGCHVGLVDDVLTTGATLEAAAQKLLLAGAGKVSAFVLARTP